MFCNYSYYPTYKRLIFFNDLQRKLDAVDEDDDDEDEEEEGAKPAVKTNNPNFLKPAATDAEDPHAGLSRKQKYVYL